MRYYVAQYDDAARQRVAAADCNARPRAHARRHCRQVRVEKASHGRWLEDEALTDELYDAASSPQSAARAGRRSAEAFVAAMRRACGPGFSLWGRLKPASMRPVWLKP